MTTPKFKTDTEELLYRSLKNILDGIDTRLIAISSPAEEALETALRLAREALKKAESNQ